LRRSARAWLAGEIDDARAVEDMAARYRRLCAIWKQARARVVGQGHSATFTSGLTTGAAKT
ncbi:MAG: DUF2090 domain-containing protein, partial [Rhodospirillaceae bacterium]|nr:DUF2090 domain-containing protein [Rhodospirillaceae bacterium]